MSIVTAEARPHADPRLGRNLKFMDGARLAAVSCQTLKNWLASKPAMPRPFKINGRLYFKESEFLAWLEGHRDSGV